MKQQQDIEQLFREQFQGFEAEVPADAWANVQQGLQAQLGASASAGTAVKAAGFGAGKIIATVAGVVAITSAAGYYLLGSEDPAPQQEPTPVVQTLEQEPEQAAQPVALTEEPATTTTEVEQTSEQAQELLASNDDRQTPQQTADLAGPNTADNTNKNTSDDQNPPQQDDAINQNGPQVNPPSNNGNQPKVQENNTDDQSQNPPSDQINATGDSDGPELPPLVSQSIVANPIGGNAPLTVSLSTSENKGNTQRLWDFGDGSDWTTDAEPEHTYTEPGIYSVRLVTYAQDGSKIIEEITVRVKEADPAVETAELKKPDVFIPNVFSPNNDGQNDKFFVKLDDVTVTQIEIRIFSMDNLLVFNSNQPDFGWEGFDRKGRILPEGTYYYLLEFQDEYGQQYRHKGSVQLLR